MKRGLKTIGLVLLVIAAVVFYGRWFFDLFGLVNYDLPMSQAVENVVQIDILDTSDLEPIVLRSLTGMEMERLLEELLQIGAARYANDPPMNYDERTIRICYADGGYDFLGNMIRHYTASGEELSTKGLYHVHSDELEALLKKYLPKSSF